MDEDVRHRLMEIEDRLRGIEDTLERVVTFTSRVEDLLNSYLSGGRGAALLALAKIHAARRAEVRR